MWISEDYTKALTFSNALNKFDECVGELIVTDQGVPVKKIGVAKRRKREKFDIANVSVVTHHESAMGLQAVHEVQRLNEANQAMATCRQQQQLHEWLSITAKTSPTLAARMLMGSNLLYARFGGTTILIWPCVEVTSFTTLPMNISNNDCYEEIPLRYSIDSANVQNQSGWLNVQDNVIYQSGLQMDCRMADQAFVNVKDTEYMYNAKSGKLSTHSSSEKLVLLPSTSSSKSNQIRIIFTPDPMYTLTDLIPQRSWNDMFKTMEMQQKIMHHLSGTNYMSPEDTASSIINNIRSFSPIDLLFGNFFATKLYNFWVLAACLYTTLQWAKPYIIKYLGLAYAKFVAMQLQSASASSPPPPYYWSSKAMNADPATPLSKQKLRQ